MGLTVKRVAKAMRRGEPARIRDGEVKGLYLDVGGPENAHWVLRYQLQGAPHWMGLGSAREVTLDQARAEARTVRLQLRAKIDPLAARRAEHAATVAAAQATKTFRQCAEAFIADHSGEWRSAEHGAQWRSSLKNYVYPRIGNLDVASIGLPHILGVLEQNVDGPRHPAGKFWLVRRVTADRTRNRIEQILAWAKARDYRQGDNPASWDILQHILPAVSKGGIRHHAALPYAELPAFMAQLRQQKSIAARALEFLILAAARAGEVFNATWSEIDLDNRIWIIPGDKMKSGKEHRVPLSDAAIALLQALPTEHGNPYVFIGSRRQRLDRKTMLAVMNRLGRSETVHGVRSAFSDWAHERTNYDNHTIEISLAHSVGNEVEKAYRRGDMFDKRRRLMADWAKFCNSPSAPAGKNIVTIGGAR